MRPTKLAVQISVAYLLISVSWILFSDSLLHSITPDDARLFYRISEFKGVMFVALTAAMMLALLRWVFQQISRSQEFSQSILDALAQHVAVLDERGVIVAVNKAWRNFAIDNGADPAIVSERADYLAVCARAALMGEHDAEVVTRAISDVGQGRLDQFSHEYSCHTPTVERWFNATVTRFGKAQQKRIVISHENITERKLAEQKLTYLAEHDVLTGLPNRRLFADRFKMACERAHRDGSLVALMAVDVDRLKIVNDSFGHDSGDRLLQAIADRLQSLCRGGDTVSRHGGDEFLLLFEGIRGTNDAAMLAQRILHAVAEPMALGDRELGVTVSVGISIFPDNGRDANELIADCDAALYEAKKAGRNGFRFYSAEMNAHSLDRLNMQQALRNAIQSEGLTIALQPQVDLATRELIGFEALVRWTHPELGVIPPARFIPLAEDTGLIIKLGDWAMRQACRQNLALMRSGVSTCPVAVNVSALQFRQPDYVDNVRRVLEDTGLSPQYLELEVTESVVLDDIVEVIGKLSALRNLGILLSLDDFGTGYSSLNYLRQFPMHRLKVDQSFVRELPDDRDSIVITHSIVGLGTNLGMRVIAEGVETVEQEKFLRAIGCQDAQGYLFARPMRSGQVKEWLAAWRSS